MVGEECLFHKWELLRTQGMEDLNELRELGEKKKEHWSIIVIQYGRTSHLIPGLKYLTILSRAVVASPCLQDRNQILWLEIHPLNHLVASPLHSCQATEFSSITFNEHSLHPQHFT